MRKHLALALLTAFVCASCSGTVVTPASPPQPTPFPGAGTFIKHVVVIVQENRSFDNIFLGYPGATWKRVGLKHDGTSERLHRVTFEDRCSQAVPGPAGDDMGHLFKTALRSVDGGKMDAFDLNNCGTVGQGPPVGKFPYSYLDRTEIAPYWNIAAQYVVADHMFPTELGTSFTSHQDLISGTTQIDAKHSLADTPTASPWGCDAPAGTTTPLVDTAQNVVAGGPFPCMTQYPTIADSLDSKHVSWKYYTPPLFGGSGNIWNAFDAIKAIRNGPDWKNNVVTPDTLVLTDPGRGRLPSVSWVIPDFFWSDHPAFQSDEGPSWVADVVNAIGTSPDWKSTAIIVLWDDWGGWYDDVPPPALDYAGLGVRVPCMIVSPYVKAGTVSHTQYEYGSILKFVEEVFNVPSIHTTDDRANSLLDSFDFTQKPRAFKAFKAKYPPSFFIAHPTTIQYRDAD